MAHRNKRLLHHACLFWLDENNTCALFITLYKFHIFTSSFNRCIEQLLLIQNSINLKSALTIVHKEHTSRFCNLCISLVNYHLHISRCSVGVVRQYINNETSSTISIRFKLTLGEIALVALSRLLDGTVDVINGYIVALGGVDDIVQRTVRDRIRRAALLHSHDNLLSIDTIDLGLFGIRLTLCGGTYGGSSAHLQGRASVS
mmetsp:Transcript_32707/g.47328  ORF Transcript_32707/g.47328 Transcript_32707/m.47328 type:complete len:202 (+) Transcript_32707:246-851(+)